MKRRQWLLQQHKSNADWAVLESVLHRDEVMELSTIERADDSGIYGKEYLPVGDIPFIDGWLRKNYGRKMLPIEVPECLRIAKFLQREYYFADKKQLPFQSSLKHFVKNVSGLKVFNSALYGGDMPGWNALPEGRYLVSGWLDIMSEFRVFVYHDRILAIQHYLGMPLVFPDPNRIREMVDRYKEDPGRPGAYAMDVAVSLDNDCALHTVIMEVHPFASCGLYGFCASEIPNMLEEGIRYYTGESNNEAQKQNIKEEEKVPC